MATTYGIEGLGRCEWERVVKLSGQVDGWCWAGHDGLVASLSPPTELVPTGWLWGWGPSRWVRWRVDPVADCVGAELAEGAAAQGRTPAFVRQTEADHVVRLRQEGHMLAWAPAAATVRGVFLVNVVDPVPATFMSLDLADAGGSGEGA